MSIRGDTFTKAVAIEAMFVHNGNLCRAARACGTYHHTAFRRALVMRFGLTRKHVADVLIIEDRRARVEVRCG